MNDKNGAKQFSVPKMEVSDYFGKGCINLQH
jgi:hypothetical protein